MTDNLLRMKIRKVKQREGVDIRYYNFRKRGMK